MGGLDLAMSMRNGTLYLSIYRARLYYCQCSIGSSVCRLPKEFSCHLPNCTMIDEANPNVKYQLAPAGNNPNGSLQAVSLG